ncbi:28S ribosomal protein S18c_ mitochondriallike, partial [Caligus rogercresseyi]
PYEFESAMCILCPRRYDIPIRPDYKNPKLLAQFVSPHTGLVYKPHITGLCQSMQEELEIEVKRAQDLG